MGSLQLVSELISQLWKDPVPGSESYCIGTTAWHPWLGLVYIPPIYGDLGDDLILLFSYNLYHISVYIHLRLSEIQLLIAAIHCHEMCQWNVLTLPCHGCCWSSHPAAMDFGCLLPRQLSSFRGFQEFYPTHPDPSSKLTQSLNMSIDHFPWEAHGFPHLFKFAGGMCFHGLHTQSPGWCSKLRNLKNQVPVTTGAPLINSSPFRVTPARYSWQAPVSSELLGWAHMSTTIAEHFVTGNGNFRAACFTSPYIPSGKRLHNHGKSHFFEIWVNPLFLWPFSIAILT